MGRSGMGEPFVAVEPGFAVVSANEKAAGAACGVEHVVIGLADTKGVDDVNEVLVGVVLAEFVALLGFNEALEYAAENIGADFLEIEGAKILQNGAPGVRRVLVAKDVRPGPVLFSRVEEGFVVAGGFNGNLECLLEVG